MSLPIEDRLALRDLVDAYATTGAWRFAAREVRRQWTRHETVDGYPSPGAS